MPPKKKPIVASVTVYMDGAAEWRWVAKAGNGEKIADSGEGYLSVSHAKKMAKEMFPDSRINVA